MNPQQNIMVTGCSSGFGFLIARTLLNDGHTVFAAMRDLGNKNADAAEQLNAQAKETKGRLCLLDMDVTDNKSVNAAAQHALEEEGHLDVVVNNAGYGVGGYAEAVTAEQLQHQLDVNVVGVHRVMRAVLPSMRHNRTGLIINISSVMGRLIIPFAGAYTASKYALEGLSENYRYELAGAGVDVVIVEPGGFGTKFLANMDNGADNTRLESYGPMAELPDKMWRHFSEQLIAEDAPDPQQIADTVLALIKTPAGHRPLRTVVDPLTGGEAPGTINIATDKEQAKLFEQMGMANMLSVRTAGRS